jgi:DNA-binding CsgD family transcriptional regulator
MDMDLIEREPELAELRSLFTESLDGQGRVVVIGGAVASGKTALLRAFAERATGSGAVFLEATAAHAERRMPLGVVRQLFAGFTPLYRTTEDVRQLLDEGVDTAMFDEGEFRPKAATRAMGAVLQELSRMLLLQAAQTPLVISVDDMHDADGASLQFLVYVAHRLKSARILLVLTENLSPWQEHPVLHADLLSHPHCRYVRLNLLTRRGQAQLLAAQFGVQTGHRLAPACHAITGGNPLLVHALIKDNRDREETTELTVDTAFPQAVLGCLHRGGPAMTSIARVLAILGEPASPTLIGRLLDLSTEQVSHTVDAMTMAALLDGGRFRHPAAPTVVLDSMAPKERAALHGRAARLLHDHGAAPTVVAGHLIAAGAQESWAVPVLEEAAEQALAEGELHTALSCLRLARKTCPDERQRAQIASALARTEWRIDPAVVGRLLPTLVSDARDGRLTRDQTITLLGYLMWYGRADEAIRILERLAGEITNGLEAPRLLMSCLYPEAVERAGVGWNAEEDRRNASAGATGQLRAAAALSAVLTGDQDYDVSGTAEQILQGARLGQTPPECVLAAIAVLVYDDQPGKAARWCDPFLEEAATQRVPVVHAALAAARALICVRQGDLIAAEQHARTALSRISPLAWGVAIGMPISVMVLATTRMGRYEDAATYLGVTVPDTMFQTPVGLHYLRARGHHYLATGHPSAALDDFRSCGELMRRWGFDIPALVTWRTDAAQALYALDEEREAIRLTEEQLAMLRPGPSTARGVSLRVQAMTGSPRRRRILLTEAVNVLEQSGDQHELALALGDLGKVQRKLGEYDEASASERDARRLTRRYAPRSPADGDAPEGARDPTAELTEAERKVAALAAQGHTNRQIAGTLLITVSTVEQHLTRVYRKLRVNRRADLRRRLRGIGPTDVRRP